MNTERLYTLYKHKIKHSHAPVSTDSISAFSVIHGLLWPEKNCKIEEINGS
jgi:hypothetical protein